MEICPSGGQTIAMEEIAPWLLDTLKSLDFLTRRIGVARCSHEDNYNKKTGRELAESRMKPIVLTVLSNEDYGSNRILVLKDDKGKVYTLEKRFNANSVHFISYE
jgi:hypothetical protein